MCLLGEQTCFFAKRRRDLIKTLKKAFFIQIVSYDIHQYYACFTERVSMGKNVTMNSLMRHNFMLIKSFLILVLYSCSKFN